MDLDNAIAKHGEWKLRLRSAILREDVLDAARLGEDCHCELGQWLHADARQKFGSLAAYHTCFATHAAFHREAGRVALAINARRFADAEAMLSSGGSYDSAALALRTAVLALQSDAAVLVY